MKLYVNRGIVRGAWGGGNLWVKAFYDQVPKLGHETCKPDDFKARPDVIFLAGLDSDGKGINAETAISYKMYVGNVKLILRVNENDARKGTHHVDKMLKQASHYIDGTVFVSDWLKDYFVDRGWECSNNTVIYNGVDREIFKPAPKIDNGKCNIVAHHWSDNRMKGADIYEELDRFVGQNDGFAFTYVGRHQCNFEHTNVISPLHGQALGEELGKHDVYVSASRFDPGPNHILEALACELPTFVHKDGGGAVEFAGTSHAFASWDELRARLEARKFENNVAVKLLDWNTCITQYVSFAESIT